MMTKVSKWEFCLMSHIVELLCGAGAYKLRQIHQGLNMAHKQQFPALECSHLSASNFGRTLDGNIAAFQRSCGQNGF